jgi:hypothetical protein
MWRLEGWSLDESIDFLAGKVVVIARLSSTCSTGTILCAGICIIDI